MIDNGVDYFVDVLKDHHEFIRHVNDIKVLYRYIVQSFHILYWESHLLITKF